MTARDYIQALPNNVTKEALEGKQTRFHFDISGDGGGQYTVAIDNGEIEVQEGLSGDPKCVVKAKDKDLVGVIKGTLNPMMAVMMGKLKISNLNEMMAYAKIFNIT